MTAIIDVDSHFEPGGDWLRPHPELAAKLPKLDPSPLPKIMQELPEDMIADVYRRMGDPLGVG